MKILVFGAGVLGCNLARNLCRAGKDVTLLARGKWAEEIKQNGQEKLLIVDDIADSFDYKNKYAIIEYLYVLAEDNLFSMIIMSHNFDFYRTVSSRLG